MWQMHEAAAYGKDKFHNRGRRGIKNAGIANKTKKSNANENWKSNAKKSSEVTIFGELFLPCC